MYVPFPTPDDQNFKADKPFNVSVAGSNIQSRVNVFIKPKNVYTSLKKTLPLLNFLLIWLSEFAFLSLITELSFQSGSVYILYACNAIFVSSLKTRSLVILIVLNFTYL